MGGGLSGLFGETGEHGLTGQGEVGYRLALKKRYRLNAGIGVARRGGISSSSFIIPGRVIGEPPVPFRGVNTYRVRHEQLQLRLGVERDFGIFAMSASVLPRYHISSQLESDFTFYSRGGEQLGEIEFTDVPLLNQRPQGYVGEYHQYPFRFSLGGSLGGSLTIDENWRVGLEYQGDIFGRDLVVSSEFDCPEGQACSAIGTFTQDVPVRNGALVLQISYTW